MGAGGGRGRRRHVIRMLPVPATMELLGDRNWWIPPRLDRRLPELVVEPAPYSRAAPLPRRESEPTDPVTPVLAPGPGHRVGWPGAGPTMQS